MESDSQLISKGPCADCGSTDACALYDDGHTHCFSCGVHTDAEGADPAKPSSPRQAAGTIPLQPLSKGLASRKLTADTTRRWRVGTADDGRLLCFPYFDISGRVVAQKCRTADKDFHVKGSLKDALLFGQQLWRDGGKRVFVTEGEIDAMTVDQVLLRRWPVVSIPNGAQGARKALSAQLPWLNKFEEVCLCFDMDDPGREAVADCVSLFAPGKVHVAELPLKDPSAMLQEDQSAPLVQALWDAKPYRPDGIVTVADLWDEVLRDPVADLPWCLPTLNKIVHGRRYGEIVMVGAGTGVGKSTLALQQIAEDLEVNKVPVGIFAFEENPAMTIKKVCGMIDNKTYHIPDTGWTKADLSTTMSRLQNGSGLYVYDHHGSTEWDVVRERIRFMHHAQGIRVFYLDNLTALVGGPGEREALELITNDMVTLMQELDSWLMVISHLATPEGKSHEEGGRVTVRNFKGSRNIGFCADLILGLERDQQAETLAERQKTTVRVLKDRYTGLGLGQTFDIKYNTDTGRYEELATFMEPANPF